VNPFSALTERASQGAAEVLTEEIVKTVLIEVEPLHFG